MSKSYNKTDTAQLYYFDYDHAEGTQVCVIFNDNIEGSIEGNDMEASWYIICWYYYDDLVVG